MTTTLYRAYDSADRLLYVGISDDPWGRLAQHGGGAGSGWTRHAVKLTFETYVDRETASAAELSAIRNDDPVWNMKGRPIDRFLQWMIAYPGRHADDISPEHLHKTVTASAAAYGTAAPRGAAQGRRNESVSARQAGSGAHCDAN